MKRCKDCKWDGYKSCWVDCNYTRKWWLCLAWWIPKVLLITLALLLGGCMNYNSEKTAYRPDGSIESRIKASMTQCGIDSSRTDFKVEVEGLGKASVGASVLDAESLAEIIKALPEGLRKEILALLGVNP